MQGHDLVSEPQLEGVQQIDRGSDGVSGSGSRRDLTEVLRGREGEVRSVEQQAGEGHVVGLAQHLGERARTGRRAHLPTVVGLLQLWRPGAWQDCADRTRWGF